MQAGVMPRLSSLALRSLFRAACRPLALVSIPHPQALRNTTQVNSMIRYASRIRPLLMSAIVAMLSTACAADSPTPGQGALATSSGAADLPVIHFVYPEPDGPIFDKVCPEWTGQQIGPEENAEVLERLPGFKAEWETTGLEYMRLILDAVGRPFPYGEMQATLSLCVPSSMGMPLMINMRRLLSSNTGLRAHDFPLIVFHETMHSYFLPLEGESALVAKYVDEHPSIRSHLHVVAAERYVLERTGRVEQLERLHQFYSAMPSPVYRRAWEIVDIETMEAVLADLALSR